MFLCLIVDYNQNVASNECLKCFCFTSYKYYSRQYVLHKLLFRSIVLLQTCLAVFSIHKTICSFCSRLSCVFHSEWFVSVICSVVHWISAVCFDYGIGLPSLLWWILIPILCLWFGTWTKTLYLDPSDWLHLVLLLVRRKMDQRARAARENLNNYKPQRNTWPLILDTPNIQGIIRR